MGAMDQVVFGLEAELAVLRSEATRLRGLLREEGRVPWGTPFELELVEADLAALRRLMLAARWAREAPPARA